MAVMIHARMACLAIAASLLASACSQDPPQPKVITEIVVDIKADNSCKLEEAAVDCADVGKTILGKYPTSKPRVDICLEKEARYEAALEVLDSLSRSGLTSGTLDCSKPAPAAG